MNKNTMIGLLAVALVFSIGGTFVLLEANSLTGAATATATGQVNLSITSTTAVTAQIAIIDFGSGYVEGGDECAMDSNGQHNQTGTTCIGFTNVTDGFYLENTGNFNISVNYSCNGNCTANEFIGGTSPAFELRVTNAFQRNGSAQTNDTSTSCYAYNDGSSAAVFNGWNLSTGGVAAVGSFERQYLSIDTYPNATLCGNTTHFPLSPTNTYDAGVIDINVSIPLDAPGTSANSTATFTFNAISSG